MEYILLVISLLLVVAVTTIKECSESYKTSKTKFRKNCFDINLYLNLLKGEDYSLYYKGKVFTFKMEKIADQEGLAFKTIPRYMYYNIYLNGLVVARIHRIETGCLTYKYAVEFSDAIIPGEVKEIISAMCKQLRKQYYKQGPACLKENSNKSLLK